MAAESRVKGEGGGGVHLRVETSDATEVDGAIVTMEDVDTVNEAATVLLRSVAVAKNIAERHMKAGLSAAEAWHVAYESEESQDASSLAEQQLDGFLLRFSHLYSFPGLDRVKKILRCLLVQHLQNETWILEHSRTQVLRCIQVLRVLTRDPSMLQLLLDYNGAHTICDMFSSLAEKCLDCCEHEHTNEMLVEMSSIVKRLTKLAAARATMMHRNMQCTLTRLLEIRDPYVLHASLYGVMNLVGEAQFVQTSQAQLFSSVFQILEQDPIPFKLLVTEILKPLLLVEAHRVDARRFNSNHVFLSVMASLASRKQQHEFCERLLPNLVALLASMAQDEASRVEIRQLGGIPALLALLHEDAVETRTNVACQVCNALTQLAYDDENAYQIRVHDGVYWLGQLLLQSELTAHVGEASHSTQVLALRTLRFLYAVEKNKQFFMRLFPNDLFEQFVDIGNYNMELENYMPLAIALSKLRFSQKSTIIARFDELRSKDWERVIGEFTVVEKLGEGAFGKVFQVRKAHSDVMFALKELDMRAEDNREEEMKRMEQEVGILRQMKHPNIVRYFSSFEQNNNFFILMEFVDGSSLTNHLASLSEKGRCMKEEAIWRVFIQLVMALMYMHTQMQVVHRDLHPSNVLVDRNMRVKITDFGLARQKKTPKAQLKSVVGTIIYQCPELVRREPYTEKADMWSLGCILYQMATLKPPFAGNPLTVAQHIVQGKFEPIHGYSALLVRTVHNLLCVTPSRRPNTLQLSQLIAPLLITELDSRLFREWRLERELVMARARHQKDLEELERLKQINEHLLSQRGELRTPPPNRVVPLQRFRWPGTPVLSVSPSQVRPIADPIEAILQQLWKLVAASQLPLSLERDPNRHLINRYKRALFSVGTKLQLKEEMIHLLSGSTQVVHFASKGAHSDTQQLTYEELHHMVESTMETECDSSSSKTPESARAFRQQSPSSHHGALRGPLTLGSPAMQDSHVQ